MFKQCLDQCIQERNFKDVYKRQVKEWMKKLDKNYIEKADQSIFEQVKELKAVSYTHLFF